uniref:Secreted protein n=1 Tax=Thraustotheca clavata TaxID=74557 RepID=A0A0A7CLD5_9STRA|nr:secreted protein [Thraustotheca clavata]
MLVKLTALLSSAFGLVQAQKACTIGSAVPYSLTIDGGAQFSQVISNPSATYLSVHIASMELPTGATLTIGTLDDTDKMVLMGSHTNLVSDFFTQMQIVIKYTAPEYHNGTVVTIDKYFAGSVSTTQLGSESLCSSSGDLSKPAACYASTEPSKYQSSQAVARVFIGGTTLCTGWLIGSEGHLITSNHCVSSQAEALVTQVEMHAECASCADPNNNVQLACKGTVVASSTTFIAGDKSLDFSLLKLNLNAGINLGQYGYLKARDGPPVVNEKVWLAGYPQANPKRIAIATQGSPTGSIVAINTETCKIQQATYQLDTLVGSSGSPVMSSIDNTVVALHSCGDCTAYGGSNSGTQMANILTYLRNNGIPIPANAINNPNPTNTARLCTISNLFISEYYQNLYINAFAGNANENFVYNPTTGAVQVQSNKQCLDSYWDGSQFQVHTWPCDSSNVNQQWTVANNQVKHRVHGVCLTTIAGQTNIAVAPCNPNDIRQWISTSCSDMTVRNFVRIQTKSGKYISEWNSGVYANTLQNNMNELFEMKGKMFQVASNGQCLDVYTDNNRYYLHTYACSSSNGNQQWNIGYGKIYHATYSNICLDFDPNDPNHAAQVWQCYTNNDNQVLCFEDE